MLITIELAATLLFFPSSLGHQCKFLSNFTTVPPHSNYYFAWDYLNCDLLQLSINPYRQKNDKEENEKKNPSCTPATTKHLNFHFVSENHSLWCFHNQDFFWTDQSTQLLDDGFRRTHLTLPVSFCSLFAVDMTLTGILPCKRKLAVRALPPRYTTREIGVTHLVASEDLS